MLPISSEYDLCLLQKVTRSFGWLKQYHVCPSLSLCMVFSMALLAQLINMSTNLTCDVASAISKLIPTAGELQLQPGVHRGRLHRVGSSGASHGHPHSGPGCQLHH